MPPWFRSLRRFRHTSGVSARPVRVLAYVTRERDGRTEVLVFDQRGDPGAGTQVPAGRADPGESPEQALRRELDEEAGLDRVTIVRELPVLGDWVARSEYENHAFEVRVDGDGAADTWEHVVHGDGDDAGLVFSTAGRRSSPGSTSGAASTAPTSSSHEAPRPRDGRRDARARRHLRPAAEARGLPRLPGRQPVEPARRRAPRRAELDRDRRLDRRRHRPAPGLRLRPLGRRSDRHPDHGRQGGRPQVACLLRLRGRVRQRAVPDPGPSQDRGRRRPPRADRRLLVLQALRAVRAAPLGSELARGLGCDLEPALEQAAAGRLDVGRRRRPADPARVSSAGARSASGHIDHALRFTVERTRRAYVYPARHFASDLDRREPAADGPARTAPRRLPDLRLPAAGPRAAPGAEDATG